MGDIRKPEPVPIFLNDAILADREELAKVAAPVAFNLVFRDSASNTDPISIWQPVPPVTHFQVLLKLR